MSASSTARITIGDVEFRHGHTTSDYVVEVVDDRHASTATGIGEGATRRLIHAWDAQWICSQLHKLPTPDTYRNRYEFSDSVMGDFVFCRGYGRNTVEYELKRGRVNKDSFTLPRESAADLQTWLETVLPPMSEGHLMIRKYARVHVVQKGSTACADRPGFSVRFPTPDDLRETDVPFFLPMSRVTPDVIARSMAYSMFCKFCFEALPDKLTSDLPRVGQYRCVDCGDPVMYSFGRQVADKQKAVHCLDKPNPDHDLATDFRKWRVTGEGARTPRKTTLTDY